ncbi:SDR family oxidoreductase [Curtobacterium sp. B8]|uniref:SDR family oxidoreductase n=1 Tax=Curtobacterium sp. B8 TaxID=95611 RepID=UPI000345D04B|nr:SDR family oxidoreductase [Curtobacterium sp. B8]
MPSTLLPLHPSLPLAGKTALVTGVSRRRGIGFAVAAKLADLGASIVVHHHRPHDLDLPWGGDDLDAVRAGLREHLTDGARFADLPGDLSDPSTIPALIDTAAALTGDLDVLVCNHAKSGDDGSILDMTPERLSAFWEVNTRATLLLTAEFARRRAPRTETPRRLGDRIAGSGPYDEAQGHVFWMTSGQIHGAMIGEVAYAASKGALAGGHRHRRQGVARARHRAQHGQPGAGNTGYMDPETTDRSLDGLDEYLASTPFGRVGRPQDPAELIGWLATSSGSWVVGQVLTSDGGFSL